MKNLTLVSTATFLVTACGGPAERGSATGTTPPTAPVDSGGSGNPPIDPDAGEGPEIPPWQFDGGFLFDGGVRPPDPPRDGGTSDAGPAAPELNPGWIGGACASDSTCNYANGFCLEESQGPPGGMCTELCARTCPDQAGALNTTTFCIASPVASQSGGICVSQCDYTKSPTGCRPGYHCESRGRFNEASTVREVCLPGPPPPITGTCPNKVVALGLAWTPTSIPDRNPSGQPNLTCHLDSPGKLSSPVRTVMYRYTSSSTSEPMTMACPLALALEKLSAHLASLDIVEVAHIGTYNCRVIAGTNELSQHGLGLAIDLAAFKHRDGAIFNVERDYEMGNSNPTGRAAKFLYDISRWMYTSRTFNIILTPDFNAAHRNHFHVDLTAGAHYLRKPGAASDGVLDGENQSFIGPNNGH
ncbi:MAG: extensin family protein [Deltaproteobacteria bacterium]|nr:extensin family protein [Deltaproteobacteria bacterium]